MCNRIVLGTFTGAVLFVCPLVLAHEPQVQRQTITSATSTLNSTSVNGRIGGYQYDGSLKPNPGQNSRFSNDANYGNAGNIVGVEQGSSASRFQSGTAAHFQSKMDFGILSIRNQMRRALAEHETMNGGTRLEVYDSGAPRLVTAREPSRIPYAHNRRPNYGRYPDELLTQPILKNSPNASESNEAVQVMATPEQSASPFFPQQRWMRDRIHQMGNELPDSWRDHGYDYSKVGQQPNINEAYYDDPYDDYFNSELGGALSLDNRFNSNAISFPSLLPSPEQTQQAFQEYLETQLLRSPDVNPLSPIQVSYQGGVVTVRGVVPTPSARVKAGNILLSDPRVSKVNNLMTCVRSDDAVNNFPNTSPVPLLPQRQQDAPSN